MNIHTLNGWLSKNKGPRHPSEVVSHQIYSHLSQNTADDLWVPRRPPVRTLWERTALKSDDLLQPDSLVDPIWERIDPNPDIHSLFVQFDKTFFKGRLASCEVKWSTRMTACAGVCDYNNGFCSIRLSQPLLQFRPRSDLVETLLHEMIHAYLFVVDRDREREEHGPKFHSLMNTINAKAGTHITVFHTFHDEVEYYQQHWWRCNGPCRNRPPYYGWVKRAMNRAPSKNDFWWEDHRRTCGGTYIKVKEPEGYSSKKKTGKVLDEKVPKQQTSLDHYFPGKGYVLNRSLSTPDLLGDDKLTKQKPEDHAGPSGTRLAQKASGSKEKATLLPGTSPGKRKTTKNSGSENKLKAPKKAPGDQSRKKKKKDDTATVGTSTGNGNPAGVMVLVAKKIPGNGQASITAAAASSADDDDLTVVVSCPVCFAYVPESAINYHLDLCLSRNS